MRDEVIVYWGIKSGDSRQTLMNLLWGPPVPLVSLLPEGPDHDFGGNYRLCSGARKLFTNTYSFIHPVTSTVNILNDDFARPEVDNSNDGWMGLESGLKNQHRLDYDFGWYFFSEEPIQIRVTPAYLHNTSDKVDGYIAAGGFDISKWFRPVNLCYLLWEGHKSITVTKGEPALYIEFLTDKKVVFKHFEMTPELNSLGNQVVGSSNFSHLALLKDRYKMFINGHRDKRVLSLIKANLLE